MIIGNKFSGYSADNRRLYHLGGGGGGTTQSTGTTYQTNVPEYAEPYVHTMLGATQKQLFDMQPGEGGVQEITGFKPYKPYSTDPSAYVAPFSPMQQQAFSGAQELGPSQLGQQAGQMAGAATYGALGAGAYDPYRMGEFTSDRAAQYMNPFLEQAMAPQLREAQRASDIMGVQQAGEATRAGAFGGSRQAIVEAERQRNLGQQLGDIRARGYMSAFDQAQQNFAREQQMREQSRQFGAGLGIQGLQTAIQGAGTMGQLGQTEFGQRQAALGMQQQFGALQQAQEQQKINQAIQDYANMQQYPLMQLGVMSNMLRGLPMQAATTNQYVAAPNPITQGIGLAGAGASIYNALKAKGGVIKEMAEGGIASVPRYDVGGEIESKLESMDTDDLQRELRESSSPTVRRMAQRILRERQMEGGADRSAPPVGPMGIDYQAPSMAGGGIVAFQSGGLNAAAENAAIDARNRAYEEAREAFFREHGAYSATPNSDELARSEAARRNITVQELAPMTLRGQGVVPSGAAAAEGRLGEAEATRSLRLAAEEARQPTPAATQTAPVARQAAAPQPAPAGITQAAPAGITQAAPAPAERRAAIPSGAATAEGAAGEAEAQAARAAGITTVQPSPVFRGVTSDIQKAAYEAQTRADRPISAFLSEIEAGKPENAAVAEYRQRIMAERANSKQEAERQRYMRAAQFFARWGSTPGPTLAAGLKALEQTIPELVGDEKEQKKVMRELDKVQFDIDNSIRLEKLGDMKEARALKEKAADRAMQLNERLAQMKTSIETSETSAEATRYSADKQYEAAKARERGAAADRGEARKSRESQQNETQFRVARDQLERVISGISREKESKSYTDDMRTLETARMMAKDDQGNFDESKLSPAYKEKYNAAKTRLEERNRDFETRRRNAEAIVDRAAAKVGVEGVSAAGSESRTVTKADVEATARSSGKSVAEVEAAFKQRGYTIK